MHKMLSGCMPFGYDTVFMVYCVSWLSPSFVFQSACKKRSHDWEFRAFRKQDVRGCHGGH